MKKGLAVGVAIATAVGLAAPAQAAPLGRRDQMVVAKAVVGALNGTTAPRRAAACRAWRIAPVRTARPFVRVAVRKGYRPRDAARGVVAGFTYVCGAPRGVSA